MTEFHNRPTHSTKQNYGPFCKQDPLFLMYLINREGSTKCDNLCSEKSRKVQNRSVTVFRVQQERQLLENFFLFLCLGLVYCWAAVSALLRLAVPPRCSTCQLHDQLVHLGNKLIDRLIEIAMSRTGTSVSGSSDPARDTIITCIYEPLSVTVLIQH